MMSMARDPERFSDFFSFLSTFHARKYEQIWNPTNWAISWTKDSIVQFSFTAQQVDYNTLKFHFWIPSLFFLVLFLVPLHFQLYLMMMMVLMMIMMMMMMMMMIMMVSAYPTFGFYLNKTGRPIVYGCSWAGAQVVLFHMNVGFSLCFYKQVRTRYLHQYQRYEGLCSVHVTSSPHHREIVPCLCKHGVTHGYIKPSNIQLLVLLLTTG